MAEYTGTFEVGSDGVNVVTGDAGSATPWDFVTLGGTSTVKYSNLQKYGALSARVVLDATPNVAYFGWDSSTLGSALTTSYGRMYVYVPTASADFFVPVQGFHEVTADRAWEILVNVSLVVVLRDTGGAAVGVGTVAISLDQWIRLEWKVINSTTAGFIECKLFNNPDSATPSETITSSGSFSTLDKTDQIRLGVRSSVVASGIYYFDNFVVNDTGYPGPLVAATGTVVNPDYSQFPKTKLRPLTRTPY